MTESKDAFLPNPVLVSVALPPGMLDNTNTVGSKVLHAAVLPVVVGLAIRLVEGTFSIGRFAEAWPVTVLFVFAYLGAWSLNSALERSPFFEQFEAAFLSASCAFIPVGLVLHSLLGPSLRIIAVVAGGGGLGRTDKWKFRLTATGATPSSRLSAALPYSCAQFSRSGWQFADSV